MKIVNRKAQHNYQLIERFEAGIVLAGHEVRAVKNGHVDLATAHAKIIGNEAYLINANITSNISSEHNPTRARKLLLHKNQIISLKTKIQAGKLTLVPTKMYTKARLIKVEIALAKSKRKFEKKELKKKKDIEREVERELKG
jgi:SsrA-binding protein